MRGFSKNLGMMDNIVVWLIICCCCLSTQGKYGGGTGTAEEPYLIYDANQMNAIGADSNDWDKYFKLMADIDLSGFLETAFNIIGTAANPFTGVFDGSGHTISNFSYTSVDTDNRGLLGYVDDPNAEIKNLVLIDPNVDAGTGYNVGSLVGYLREATITNCYVDSASVKGDSSVGGLVGFNYYGTISNCYLEGVVSGMTYHIGGLVGWNEGTISNCYSTGDVSGDVYAGGLVGYNSRTITNCYAMGSVSGTYDFVGGLVGFNSSRSTIINSYSTASVTGYRIVGGLVGENWYGTITNCYSTGSVSGNRWVGGLVGVNSQRARIQHSFWDIETSGGPDNGIGTPLPTEQMQTASTFTDAGWDFITPVWTIDEGVDYPRLWWEFVPVLYAEPEVTLGTSNAISWGPVYIAVEYYAECSEDANFASIIYNSGWIKEKSFEFTGLELGQRYWYSVKARNTVGTESSWSNVETSLQGTLADAVDIMLAPESLKNENMKNALLNKVDEVLGMIDEGLYADALDKLEYDILAKMNGCRENGEPDGSDWIITCEAQNRIYLLVIETIEYVNSLMEQSPD